MEECIARELCRLRAMGLIPSCVLLDAQEYEDIKARYMSMVRVYGGSAVPSNTFMGVDVLPVVNLRGGFQVAVENGIQSLRGVL